MKHCFTLSLFIFLAISASAQDKTEEMHRYFLLYLQEEKIDSLFTEFSKIGPGDEGYEEALLYRNQYGWALGRIEELKKDIPAILGLPGYSTPLAYERVFRPQKFPPSEWDNFYTIADELEEHFKNTPRIQLEMLSVKTSLDFYANNTQSLLINLPNLISLLNKDSKAYPVMLWQYGSLLLRIDSTEAAWNILESGWNETADIKFLQSLIYSYSWNKKFDQIIDYEDQIQMDSSGSLYYPLGLAYLNKKDSIRAREFFDRYTSKFAFIEKPHNVQIEYNNHVYPVGPDQLEVLGDFYSALNKESSCVYYSYAAGTIENSNDEARFKRELSMIKDENQRTKMKLEFIEHQKEQQERLKRIQEKLQTECKLGSGKGD